MKKKFTKSILIRNSWILSLLVVLYVPGSAQTSHRVDVTSNIFTPSEIMIAIELFVDHNGNGYYDAPPMDHAWRLEIAGAAGDATLDSY